MSLLEPAPASLTDDPPVTDDLVLDLLEDVREVTGVLAVAWPSVPAARSAGPDGPAARPDGAAGRGG